MDHLDFIHIRGLDGGPDEIFQGIAGGEVSFSGDITGDGGTVNLDVTPLVEALAPLQELAGLAPLPVDLTPILEALAPLSSLERITATDLTGVIEQFEEISGKMVAYDLSGITQALEALRDRVADLAFKDAKIDFGFFKVWLLSRIAEM